MARTIGTAKGWTAALLALAATGWLTGPAWANPAQAARAIARSQAEALEAEAVIAAARDRLKVDYPTLDTPIYPVNATVFKAQLHGDNPPAFRRWHGDRPEPQIYVNTQSGIYQRALKGERAASMVLSAVIAHEITHARTKGESAPSRKEAEVLERFLRDISLTDEERYILAQRLDLVNKSGGIK